MRAQQRTTGRCKQPSRGFQERCAGTQPQCFGSRGLRPENQRNPEITAATTTRSPKATIATTRTVIPSPARLRKKLRWLLSTVSAREAVMGVTAACDTPENDGRSVRAGLGAAEHGRAKAEYNPFPSDKAKEA